jgi:pyrroloquinoline-quinone synthase
MSPEDFQEALLQIMERKRHWAWPDFTGGKVAKEKLHIHLEQEYEVYVRDFPVMVGWAYVQCPIPVVRQDLAENLFEEETGGLVAGRPHPELFLEYPKGMGMDLERFKSITLLPRAQVYRDLLDRLTQEAGWDIATAVVTLFIEGTPYDRSVLDPNAPARPEPSLSDHPLVKHYGLSVEHLALTKAHREVEGEHRDAGWRMVINHIPGNRRQAVVDALELTLQGWLAFRDEVAEAVGLTRA